MNFIFNFKQERVIIMKRGLFNVFLVLFVCVSMLLSSVSVMGVADGDDVGDQSHDADVEWENSQIVYTIYEFENEVAKIEISLENFGDDDIANISLNYNGTNNFDIDDVLAPIDGLQTPLNPYFVF